MEVFVKLPLPPNKSSLRVGMANSLYTYIFDEATDKTVKDIYRSDFPRLQYSRQPDYVIIEDRRENDSVMFYIQQTGAKAGKLRVKFEDPADPKENMFSEIAPKILEALKKGHHIINVRRTTQRKNRATRREKKSIGKLITKIYENKTGQSGRPGHGPANTIRKMVGVQPPKKMLPHQLNVDHLKERGNMLGALRALKGGKRRTHKRRKQRGGARFFTPYGGSPDDIPRMGGEEDFKQNGYDDYPAPKADATESTTSASIPVTESAAEQ